MYSKPSAHEKARQKENPARSATFSGGRGSRALQGVGEPRRGAPSCPALLPQPELELFPTFPWARTVVAVGVDIVDVVVG